MILNFTNIRIWTTLSPKSEFWQYFGQKKRIEKKNCGCFFQSRLPLPLPHLAFLCLRHSTLLLHACHLRGAWLLNFHVVLIFFSFFLFFFSRRNPLSFVQPPRLQPFVPQQHVWIYHTSVTITNRRGGHNHPYRDSSSSLDLPWLIYRWTSNYERNIYT